MKKCGAKYRIFNYIVSKFYFLKKNITFARENREKEAFSLFVINELGNSKGELSVIFFNLNFKNEK